MSTLSDVQHRIREAVVRGDFASASPVLIGGRDPISRLAVHHRHFHASLLDAIRTRFPATAWLIGDMALTAGAQRFIAAHPPRVVCIAEFGSAFPAFLAQEPSSSEVPYLESFATLEWHVGRVSVAVGSPAIGITDLTAIDPQALMSAAVVLQPGVIYLTLEWPVDELMRLYLSTQAPPAFQIHANTVEVEVFGVRGELKLTRLSAAAATFRSQLQSGATLSAASEAAMDCDAAFDPGRALVELCDSGALCGLSLSTADVD
ncbi:MAG: DNA-binding domain-containing protein [Bryobacteraceae bacterium]|nr:DNA-binding domain-containing protein [Bryobacteraceae bacterium]